MSIEYQLVLRMNRLNKPVKPARSEKKNISIRRSHFQYFRTNSSDGIRIFITFVFSSFQQSIKYKNWICYHVQNVAIRSS